VSLVLAVVAIFLIMFVIHKLTHIPMHQHRGRGYHHWQKYDRYYRRGRRR
jgi:uncharacterized protein HemY